MPAYQTLAGSSLPYSIDVRPKSVDATPGKAAWGIWGSKVALASADNEWFGGAALVLGMRGLAACGFVAAIVVAVMMPARVTARANERSLSIYNIHTKETVTAVFKRNGRFVESGMAELSHAMRDHRRNETIRMDPELIDLVWQLHSELGSREPVHLVSGYRSPATNAMLRRTSGGQASRSRHMVGKAADLHFPDVPVKKLRYSALVQEKGGVGYYPNSALPFVHVDTDRVRSWPRLPRHELALLFPSGETRHAAADGGPITKDDVRAAAARHRELAREVASFHVARREHGVSDKAGPVLAALQPSASANTPPGRIAALPTPVSIAEPALLQPPMPVQRRERAAVPARITASLSPSAVDRARLAELASLVSSMPRLLSGPVPARRPAAATLPSLTGTALPVPPGVLGRSIRQLPERQVASLGPVALPDDISTLLDREPGGGWAPQAAYDDEHPDELFYRPFAIVPHLTETATSPVMSEFTAIDVDRTVDVLDQPDAGTAMKFRPAGPLVGALWAQQFTGAAVDITRLDDLQANRSNGVGSVRNRTVRTSNR
jgi:uncharacterized protein YcbK (DUF882 family)